MSIEVTNGVHVTLTSGTDEPCVLRRNVANMSLLQVSGGSVRVENLIWDGNRENFNDNASWGFLLVTQGGELVLGKGTVIRNSSAQAYGAAAIVRGTGSRLVMEDGALITDCHGSGNSYGSTVMIGTSGTAPADPKPIFEMRGGLITGCSANSTGLPSGGYSGVVYTWSGGVFLMSGGKITGNTSNKGSPGVVNYLGTTRLTGDAYIEGNDGPYPGIYNCSTYITTFFGDFRGRAAISSGVQDGSEHLYVKAEDEFATGAWCFYPALGDANLVGSRVGTDLRIYWKPAIGSVSGVKAASAAELKMIIPSTLDLTAESFDLTKLPFELSGAACDLSGEIALAFDSRTLSHSGALPLSLIAPAADETLTGSWSFTTPSTARGNWQVVSRATEGDYALTYTPASLIFQLY